MDGSVLGLRIHATVQAESVARRRHAVAADLEPAGLLCQQQERQYTSKPVYKHLPHDIFKRHRLGKLPDQVIFSCSTFSPHSLSLSNRDVVFAFRLTGPCNKNLKTFPIDQQSCVLVYESFSHNYEEVKMEWITNGPPITLLNNIQLPDYTLVNFSSTTVKRVSQLARSRRSSLLSSISVVSSGSLERARRYVHISTALRVLHSASLRNR